MISIFRPGLQKIGTSGTHTQTHTHTHTLHTHVDTNRHIHSHTLSQNQVEQRHSLTQKKLSQVDLTTLSGKSGKVGKKFFQAGQKEQYCWVQNKRGPVY